MISWKVQKPPVDRSCRGPSQWPLVGSEPWSCLRSGWGTSLEWGFLWIQKSIPPRFVTIPCYIILYHFVSLSLYIIVTYIYIYIFIDSLSRLFFVFTRLPYWATHSADEVGTQTISPFYWALESGSFHSAKVGCGKELKLGFTVLEMWGSPKSIQIQHVVDVDNCDTSLQQNIS